MQFLSRACVLNDLGVLYVNVKRTKIVTRVLSIFIFIYRQKER